MLTSLNHIGFSVADLDRSIEFYTELLGYPPYFKEVYDVEYVGRIVGYPGAVQYAAFFKLPGDQGLFLELIQYLKPEPRVVDMESYNAGIAHLCLAVDDLDAEFERITAIGGRFRSESVVQSDYGIYVGARSAYFRDPDDISIQLVELVDGVDPGLEG
ncbi:VOC family protein [Nocardioides endophyticus]|uniref:VOC family protein n=1 Tax=Nocardioides endophyticus TaxID=1353775 RepID=A0ABP8ZAG0_9ACTN